MTQPAITFSWSQVVTFEGKQWVLRSEADAFLYRYLAAISVSDDEDDE